MAALKKDQIEESLLMLMFLFIIIYRVQIKNTSSPKVFSFKSPKTQNLIKMNTAQTQTSHFVPMNSAVTTRGRHRRITEWTLRLWSATFKWCYMERKQVKRNKSQLQSD